MPGGVVEDEALGEEIAGGCVQGLELGVDVFEGLGFGGATLVVETVEFFGEFGGARGVFREEEFYDVAGYIHTSCSIDARCESETYFSCSWSAVDGDLCDLHQSAEAGLNWVSQLAQTE